MMKAEILSMTLAVWSRVTQVLPLDSFQIILEQKQKLSIDIILKGR